MTDLFAPFITSIALQEAPPVVPGMPGAGGTIEQAPLPGPGGGPAGGAEPGGLGGIFWIVILMFVVLMVVTSMSGRKQRKQRDQLISSLKRNDRVQTVGGIIGTVIELNDTEMVLRVEETSNTKIRFARSSVQQVLREGKDSGKAESKTDSKTETPAESAT